MKFLFGQSMNGVFNEGISLPSAPDQIQPRKISHLFVHHDQGRLLGRAVVDRLLDEAAVQRSTFPVF